MKNATLSYTVVIPTFNEEETIEAVGSSVAAVTRDLVIIDGNSPDRTRAVAESRGWKVVLQRSKGKGAALRQAIDEIDSDILVFIDADCSHEASDIPKLVEPIIDGRADLVIASRLLGGSDELHGTWHNFVRMIGSCLITLGINYRWGVRLTDVENGFRAIRRDVARSLDLKARDFTIEQEMVLKAVRKGCRIVEIPSHEYERKGGESKLPTRQGWRFVLQFLLYLW